MKLPAYLRRARVLFFLLSLGFTSLMFFLVYALSDQIVSTHVAQQQQRNTCRIVAALGEELDHSHVPRAHIAEVVERALGPIAGNQKNLDVQIVHKEPEHSSTLWTQARCVVALADGEFLVVQRDLQPGISQLRREYAMGLLALAPVPMLLAFIITVLFLRRINRSVGRVRDAVEQVNSLQDFRYAEFDRIDLGVDELNRLFDRLLELVSRLRNVAVDKSILQFEMTLLEKFIITSEVIHDWRDYVNDLLREINSIIEAYALFTIFKIDEDRYEIEIFWRNTPQDSTRALLEKFVNERLIDSPFYVEGMTIDIRHNVADSTQCLSPLSRTDLELQTKSLLLETPKIGGTVGIGVQSYPDKDSVRLIVIESILTTLLNVIGSAKAIHKYTRDLEYYATRDPLTHLYNQRVFWEMAGYEIKRAERHSQPFSMLMMDFDNFKQINDLHGHSFGDDFLRHYSQCIHDSLRSEDILCRYGGDEFCAILPEARVEQATNIANRVRDAITGLEMVAPDGLTSVCGTVSIGIATYPDHGDNVQDIFLVADSMVYRSKAAGKDSVSVPGEDDLAEIFRESSEKMALVMDALRLRQVYPHFQPICDVATGNIDIHEMLMRIDIDSQSMPAGEFIHIAEKLGIIHELDTILAEKAFAQIRETGYQGMLFVNISPRALIVSHFIPTIQRLASEYEIPRSQIVFEITERETIKNFTVVEKLVRELKLQGFKFAIDDFGSGFSSFHYLKRFPIDFLKIEGDFIVNMHNDERDYAFVRSIVYLARELGIQIVAEFVESQEILDLVGDVGIEYAQGFHIGRPQLEFAPVQASVRASNAAEH